ncbi:YlbF family regulator [Bacillus sp. L381]|uniref:YlbF family regulator n=1 Tax=Bacillus TaxID=1386 RepID=UPI000824652A|nr:MULTISPECIES: YlbF family regulator [Bacillus]AOC90915.1 Regulatory protein YlbF [Bacillus amyloliquefaciens]MCR9038014.1 YlbF family regulator [Bacillus velezensis]QUN10922.1 YlbF family regulator [Bacillus amyloliquefaciens]QYM84056.1 YlbF family regulator [Bacillus sp. 7D3]QZY13236.1 YlbF family regulator [Bacillus amyloliquefaciens]
MYATIESVRLQSEAEQLAGMILQSETAENYRDCYKRLQEDEEARRIIRSFMSIKEQYEDVQRFGKYHPDYREISRKMREMKRELDLNDKVAEFKKAETELQSLLDEISIELGTAVSEHVKVPTGNPYFDGLSSCGGGCGSGGGCGCKVS